MHYLCTRKQEISLRQIKIHRGMEQLVARRAHNPKVVWFESHSRYSKGETFVSPFFVSGVPDYIYIPSKSPFGKGGLVVHQINLIKSTIVQYYVLHNAKGETKVFSFFVAGAALGR